MRDREKDRDRRKKAKKSRAILGPVAVILMFLLLDYGLSQWKPVESSKLFWRNDYEIILETYGTSEFKKAFYGNSAVIASYFDDQSSSGFVNIGIDYGKVSDIYEMLEGGFITVSDELVIGLNMFCFLDTLDTNPSYPWHRKPYEPYVYFQRERLYPFLTEGLERFLRGEDFVYKTYEDSQRMLYYNILDDKELAENIERQRDNYWNQGIENFSDNLEDLEKLIALCEDRGIKLRAVWMPWNGKVSIPDIEYKVQDRADKLFHGSNIEVLNMKSSISQELFHDIGHLECRIGSPVFTEMISPWLSGGELADGQG